MKELSIQREINATIQAMKKTRLRISRLVDKAFREADQDEVSIDTRLRVISILTKALKDLGSNITQLKTAAKVEAQETPDDTTLTKILEE
ncbi:MAG: hypothetical protein JRJ69_10420 [Deltaproteobacteria bacterium]|nr:hypothetical protein [Deltaproteobacteria bacterium]